MPIDGDLKFQLDGFDHVYRGRRYIFDYGIELGANPVILPFWKDNSASVTAFSKCLENFWSVVCLIPG